MPNRNYSTNAHDCFSFGRGVAKASVLRVLVRHYTDRWYGFQRKSSDLRLSTPYFKQFAEEILAVVISSGNENAPAALACASGP